MKETYLRGGGLFLLSRSRGLRRRSSSGGVGQGKGSLDGLLLLLNADLLEALQVFDKNLAGGGKNVPHDGKAVVLQTKSERFRVGGVKKQFLVDAGKLRLRRGGGETKLDVFEQGNN